jgi:ABC-2 type transport system permease protein
MPLSVFRKTLRDQRFAVIGGGAGILALSLYLTYVYPYIGRARELLEFIEKLPPFARKFIDPSVFASPEGFFNLQPFSVLGPLVFLAYAIVKGSDLIAGEEERGTLDLLMANPISRTSLLLQKAGAAGVVIAYLAAILWVGMMIGCKAFSIALRPARLLAAVFSLALFTLAVFVLSLAAACLKGRKRAAAASVSGFLIAAFLVQSYAPMVDWLRPWRFLSPFFYYNGNSVLLNGLKGSHVAVLAILAAVSLGLAVFFFNRRDLRV